MRLPRLHSLKSTPEPTDDVLCNTLLFNRLNKTDFDGFGQAYQPRMEETVIPICAFSKCSLKYFKNLGELNKQAELEINRFDQNFTFEVNLSGLQEDQLSGIYLSPLLWQPFVENAIWHGLLPSNEVVKKLETLTQKVQCDILISIDDNRTER